METFSGRTGARLDKARKGLDHPALGLLNGSQLLLGNLLDQEACRAWATESVKAPDAFIRGGGPTRPNTHDHVRADVSQA